MFPISSRAQSGQICFTPGVERTMASECCPAKNLLKFVTKKMHAFDEEGNDVALPRIFGDFFRYGDLNDLAVLIDCVNRNMSAKGLTVDEVVCTRLRDSMIGVDVTSRIPRVYNLIDRNEVVPSLYDGRWRAEMIDTALFSLMPEAVADIISDYDADYGRGQQIHFSSKNAKFIVRAFLGGDSVLKRKLFAAAISQNEKDYLNDIFVYLRKNSKFINLTNVDLRGLNLTHLNMSMANFNGSNLSEADLSESVLQFVQLTNADCIATNFNFSELNNADLSDSNFSAASFHKANLTGSICVGTHFQRTCLDFATCVGTDFTRANLTGTSLINGNLKDAILKQSNLNCADLTRTNLGGCQCDGTDLSWVNISRADFGSALLTDVILNSPCSNYQLARPVKLGGIGSHEAVLNHLNVLESRPVKETVIASDQTAIDFRNERFLINALSGGDRVLKRQIVKYAVYQRNENCLNGIFRIIRSLTGTLNFSLVDLSGLVLTNLDLAGANLHSVNLSRSNLRSLNLRGANMSGALLEFADFSNANMTGAKITDAVMTGALFCGATLNNVNFSNSKMCEVDFTGALFGNTQISATDADCTDLTGAITGDQTLQLFFNRYKKFLSSKIIVNGVVLLSSVKKASPVLPQMTD